MHRYPVGGVYKLRLVEGSHMDAELQRYLGREVQITRHIAGHTPLDSSHFGPPYEVQSLDDGAYFYAAEACLEPRIAKGSWEALKDIYVPPSRTKAPPETILNTASRLNQAIHDFLNPKDYP